MKKYVIILWLFVVLAYFFNFSYGQNQTKAGDPLIYRLEYTVQGQTTGAILLIFRYRFFFSASASVLLECRAIDEKNCQFNFREIDETGYLLSTRGLSGKGFSICAADYHPANDEELLVTGMAKTKELAPDYFRFIKTWKTFAFKILSNGEKTLAFKRVISGIHTDFFNEIKVEPVKSQPNFYFNIYAILMDMVQIYNHSCLPDDRQKICELQPGMSWESADLDFTGILNCIGAHAAKTVEKFVKFKQKRLFKVKYCVASQTPKKLTVTGTGAPAVEIFGSYKIDKVNRFIELRLPDGVVLVDRYRIEIKKNEEKGGFAEVVLSLVQ